MSLTNCKSNGMRNRAALADKEKTKLNILNFTSTIIGSNKYFNNYLLYKTFCNGEPQHLQQLLATSVPLFHEDEFVFLPSS